MIATKSGSSGGNYGNFMIRKRMIFQRIREIREVLRLVLFYIKGISFSYSITHTVECENCEMLPFCISFCSVQSLLSTALYFMNPKIRMANNMVRAFPYLISVQKMVKSPNCGL